MTKPLATGTTNEEVGSCVEVEVDCGTLWSAAQQFAYLRLSEDVNDDEESLEVDLLDSYYARSKRIAATYARLYLETEEGGDVSKKGRYYWMALGAFASKTVSCLLDNFSVKSTALTGMIVDKPFDLIDDGLDYLNEDRNTHSADYNIISEGLGLGNFWLFMDVAPWHWFNNNYDCQFLEGMACINERDVQKYEDIPKEVTTKNLQWANYALSKINDLKVTSYIQEGMQLAKEVEEEVNPSRRASKQFDHLQAIANHEQEMILQKLIYNHSDFTHWIKQQRNIWLLNLLSPAYELVFTSGCSTENDLLLSEAPDDLELEVLGALDDGADSKTRMGWIGVASGKFHQLMQDPVYSRSMEAEIRTMASWVNEADGMGPWFHPSSFD